MEPTVLGGRLASSVVGPLVRKLFASDGPGAGLVFPDAAVIVESRS
ncbi:hypothetical protein OG828_22110 [Streptomyces sp. NBC_00457]